MHRLLSKKATLGVYHRWKNKFPKYSHNISIDCKFYVLSENYKDHMLKINRNTPSRQNIPWGLPLGWKMRFSKNDHVIYQSIENFVLFLKKNIRTVCSKSTENHPGGKIAILYMCIHHCTDTVRYIRILLFCICSVRSISFYIHT